MKPNQFYCVKCRSKVTEDCDDIKIKKYNLKNGRKVYAKKSVCHKCDTNLTKFIKNPN